MARRAAAETAQPAANARRRSKGPRMVVWGVAGLLAATFVRGGRQPGGTVPDQRSPFPACRSARAGQRSADLLGDRQLFTPGRPRSQSVFAATSGRSVYLCPISQRREQLLAIDWVEEATVSRIWPNRLSVAIRERKPVAFVQVEGARRRHGPDAGGRRRRAVESAARGAPETARAHRSAHRRMRRSCGGSASSAFWRCSRNSGR